MELAEIRKKYLIEGAELQSKNHCLDERISEDYISNMANVLNYIDRFSSEIGPKDIVYRDFLKKRSNCLMFKVRSSGNESLLKLDVELCVFLDDRLKKMICTELADLKRFGPENRRAIARVKHSVGKSKESLCFPDNVLFRIAEDVEAGVNNAISNINVFRIKAKPSALRLLDNAYIPPNQAKCQTLYCFITALDSENPYNRFAVESYRIYFRCDLRQVEPFILPYINRLGDSVNRLSINAAMIIGQKLKKNSSINRLSWQNDSLDFLACLEEFELLNENTKFWVDLQRYPFEKIKDLYSHDKVDVTFRNILKLVKDDSEKILRLAYLFQSILDHVEKLTLPDKLPRVSLELESSLGLIKYEDYNDNMNWIFDNRMKLISLLAEILTEVEDISPGKAIPRRLRTCLEDIQYHRATVQSELRERLINEREFISVDIEMKLLDLKALFGARKRLLESSDKMNICRPGVLGSLVAGFGDASFFEEVKLRMKLVDEIIQKVTLIEDEILAKYSCEHDLTRLSLDERDLCIKLSVVNALKLLYKKDDSCMNFDYFNERVALLSLCVNKTQKVLLLSSIIEEYYLVQKECGVSDMEEYFESDEQESLCEFVKKYRDEVSDKIIEKEKELYMLVQKVEGLDNDTFLRCIGLRDLSPRYVINSFSQVSNVLNLVNVKNIENDEDKNLVDIQSLESQLIELQKAFHETKFDDMVFLIESRFEHKMSKDFLVRLKAEFNVAYDAFKNVKSDVDSLTYDVKNEENYLGAKRDINHFEMTIQFEDILKTTENYAISEEVSQDDIKLFGYVQKSRQVLLFDLYVKYANKFLLNKASNKYEVRMFDRFRACNIKRKTVENWVKMGKIESYDAIVLAYLLYLNPVFLTLSIRQVALFLNFCVRDNFSEKDLYQNFMLIFSELKRNSNSEFKDAIFYVKDVVVKELKAHVPYGRDHDYIKSSGDFIHDVMEKLMFMSSYKKPPPPPVEGDPN